MSDSAPFRWCPCLVAKFLQWFVIEQATPESNCLLDTRNSIDEIKRPMQTILTASQSGGSAEENAA